MLHIESGDAEIHLAKPFRIRVTPESGLPFIASWEGRELGFFLDHPADGSAVVVAPRTSYDVVIPAVDLTQPSWALDDRLLTAPSRWQLEVLLYDSCEELEREPVVVSTPLTLTIEAPSAADLRTVEAIRRRNYSSEAQRLVTQAPESRYFPYFAALVTQTPHERAALLAQVLNEHRHSPVVPWLRFSRAHALSSAAIVALGRNADLDGAVAFSNLAREELVRLSSEKDVWSRRVAADRLETLPGRSEFLEVLRRREKQAGSR